VHDVQVVEKIPQNKWDVPANIIATPTRVIRTLKNNDLFRNLEKYESYDSGGWYHVASCQKKNKSCAHIPFYSFS
jgi:hypothetical protein